MIVLRQIFPQFSCFGSARNEVIVVMIQKVSASLSIFGSTFIIYDIVKKIRNGKKTDPYQRIMVALSFFYFILSFFAFFLGSWVAPKESGWMWAVGNTASCTMQGFLLVLGTMGELTNQTAVSFNILMLIVFGWNQEKFAKRIENPLHIAIVVVALSTAVVPFFFQLYNPACGICNLRPRVGMCGNGKDDEVFFCIVRGNHETVYWAIYWIVVATKMFALIFCTIAMLWVYFYVRRQENKNQRYNFRGHNANNHKESMRIRKILLLYTASLYLSHGVSVFCLWVKLPTSKWFIARALIPMRGFFNFLVYFLPNCLKYQQDHPGAWLVTAYFQIVRSRVDCPFSPSEMCGGRNEDVVDAPEMNFATFNTNLATYNTSISPDGATATVTEGEIA